MLHKKTTIIVTFTHFFWYVIKMEAYARATTRFAAYLIDVAATAVLQLPLWIWYARGLAGPESGLYLLGYTIVLPMIWVLTRALYLISFWRWAHMTLGMQLLSVKIDPMSRGRLTLWKCLLRYLGMILCTYSIGIGYLMMFWNSTRQGLHDKISSTIVLDSRKH